MKTEAPICPQKEGFLPEDKTFATRAVTTRFDPEQWSSWSVVTPIIMATTYKQKAPAQPKKYIYGRSGNPTREVLQDVIAALEKAKYAVCFASGLGAGCTASFFLKGGDNVIACSDVYGGMYRMFDRVIRESGVDVTFADLLDFDELKRLLKPTTKMIWLETPSNPLLKIYDIEGIVKIARQYNKDILVVVDNTFLSPYFQKPLEFGADVVIHSLTKYINGHSDVIMGAAVTNNEKIFERLQFLQNACGIIPSPFDCYMVNRSIKTMTVRMKQHMISSYRIARFLEEHPLIEKVLHPGLKSHPQYELAKRQTSGWSGMLSFYVKGGLRESSLLIEKLQIFTLAESLGGFESLIEIPSIMTHASVPVEEKRVLGLTDNLIRVSVGLEATEDLIADLKQALEIVWKATKVDSAAGLCCARKAALVDAQVTNGDLAEYTTY